MEIVMKKLVKAFVCDTEGQDLIEYALLAGLIAVASYLLIKGIGTNINSVFSTVNSDLTAAS